MRVESQFAILCLAAGAAFTLPEISELMGHASLQPSYYYLLGGVLGSVGLYFGMAPSLRVAKRLTRDLLVSAWLLLTLLLSFLMQLGAYSAGGMLQAGCYAAAVMPLAMFALALVLAQQAERKAARPGV